MNLKNQILNLTKLKVIPKILFVGDNKGRVLITLLLAGLFTVFISNMQPVHEQQFVFLAESFLKGELHFLEQPSPIIGWGDTSPYKGNHYWPLGVFPAILLTPGVALFGKSFHQGYIAITFTVISAILLVKIARHYTKDKNKALFLCTTYIFGSAYIMVTMFPVSWYFAHVVATTLLLGALYSTILKRSALLSGGLFAGAFLTRISVFFGILFFIPVSYTHLTLPTKRIV